MRQSQAFLTALLTLSLAGAPAAQAQGSQSSLFVQTDPSVVASFKGIAQHAGKLAPMLDEVHAKDWLDQGAPDTYIAQLDSARVQIRAIATEMDALTEHPERMQECIKAIFRVQTFRGSLNSLLGGLRKYQSPPLADLIQAVSAEDQSDLERLQTYILELADTREQEFAIVDHEAQRCRAQLSKQPPPSALKAPAHKP